MMVQNKERVLIIPNSVQLENQSSLIMAKSPQLNLSNSIGLDLKWSNLTTLSRGSNSTPSKGNIRDYANINQLICLSNMENLNAVFINKGMPQRDRLIELNKIAIQQMKVLEGVEERRMLK
jgi:hypothetical protein